MKISEKQILQLIRIAQATANYAHTENKTQKIIANLLEEIYSQQSEELKETE